MARQTARSVSSVTVAVLYRREREFAMARTGKRSWRLVNNKLDRIVDMARHGDSKLYTVHLSGRVARWKFECCYLAGAPRGRLYLLKRVYKHKQCSVDR
ncbi:hypothetical protein OsI_15228 [Oryza sativa Indica Group]|uniref:KIB1-4 beta-propeller domain-containing protein n=1 Tax=Oryza sativa subsp. indica TaxID=39946 RepID=A2XRG7_ORYSI|nr:hypothetical protein OsI_15228 [Oryza sativa Indica Group]